MELTSNLNIGLEMDIKLSNLKKDTLYKAKLDSNGESVYITVKKIFKNGKIKFNTINHENDKGFCVESMKMGPIVFNKLFQSIETVIV